MKSSCIATILACAATFPVMAQQDMTDAEYDAAQQAWHARHPDSGTTYQPSEYSRQQRKTDCTGWTIDYDPSEYPYVFFTHYNWLTEKYDYRFVCGAQNGQRICLVGDPESREFNKGPIDCEQSCPPPIWKVSSNCPTPAADAQRAMFPTQSQEGQQQ